MVEANEPAWTALGLFGANQEAVEKTILGRRSYERGDTIVHAGAAPSELHLLVAGWAARWVPLEDGSRAITDFHLQGDLCDLSALGSGAVENVTALTTVSAILLDRQRLVAALETQPRLATAFLRMAVREQASLRTWLTCMGKLEKRQHVAHLFCELHERLRRVGGIGDHAFDLPLTQADLADALGMTVVHTNRVLQGLRRDGIIALGHHHLEILRPAELRTIAAFDPQYLAA